MVESFNKKKLIEDNKVKVCYLLSNCIEEFDAICECNDFLIDGVCNEEQHNKFMVSCFKKIYSSLEETKKIVYKNNLETL